MKQKTQELTGPTLDYFVAKALGLRCALEVHPMTVKKAIACWVWPEGRRPLPDYKAGPFDPSTNWAKGGPIIEREGIAVWRCGGGWAANMPGDNEYPGDSHYIDASNLYEGGVPAVGPLIAAMRAFVAAKLGDEVET